MFCVKFLIKLIVLLNLPLRKTCFACIFDCCISKISCKDEECESGGWNIFHWGLLDIIFDNISLLVYKSKNLSIMYQYITEKSVVLMLLNRYKFINQITFYSTLMFRRTQIVFTEVTNLYTKTLLLQKNMYLGINYTRSSDVFNACWIGAALCIGLFECMVCYSHYLLQQ